MTKATTRRRPRRDFWIFVSFALIFSYLSLLGATFNGVIGLVELQPFTLGLLGLLAGVGMLLHWRRGWTWHRTLLDGVFILWGMAFAISIAANSLTWRRSAEALWYMLLYIGLWYALMDALANGGLTRQVLVQSFIFAGFIVMLFGWWQVVVLLSDPAYSGLPRPVSLIGNANAFGAYMVLLLPFPIMQAFHARSRLPRVIMALNAISAFALLILSQSRAGWIGAVAGLGLLGLLLLAENNLLSLAALRNWWRRQSGFVRSGLIVGAIVMLAVGLLMAIYLVNSLSMSGRSLSLRTYLWNAALMMFREQPLTGQGFFTYGQHLPHYASIPPTQPQAHAHNVPFTIMAEMGLPGLLALTVTVGLVLWTIIRNWRRLSGTDRPYFMAGAAALVGFGIHHLLDTPAMMPLIAKLGLLVLALAVAPDEPRPIRAAWRKAGQPLLLIGLWALLLVAGFWHINLMRQYVTTLRGMVETEDHPVTTADYHQAATAMQALVDADPRQPAYVLQQGYLYGMVAADGNIEAAESAIDRYRRYLELEPTHAAAWSNLAALYWQMDNQAQARAAIEQAIRFAPDWPHFKRQRDIYAGVLSDAATIEPPLPPYSLNWSRFQYLREPLPAYLPQVGWGS